MNEDGKGICFKDNSLTFFRYIAAFQVLFNHGEHMQISIPACIDIPFRLFQGVPMFFGLSGFLIWKSLEREECFRGYIKKRFFRLFPELWMVVFFSIMSIIILYEDVNGLLMGIFAFAQASVFQFWTPSELRGFGVGSPNGSLWTISVFVQFYLIIFFLHKWLKKKSLKTWLVILGIALAFNNLYPVIGGLSEIVQKLYGQTLLPFFYLFFIGCLISRYFDFVMPLIKKFWWMFLLLDAFLLISGLDFPGRFGPLRTISLIIAVIGLAYVIKVQVKIDLSYEIYLIHMVVINIFVQLGCVGNYGWYILVVFLSVVFAMGIYIAQKKILSILQR